MLPLRFSVTSGVVLGDWQGERAGAQQPVWGCRAPFPPSPPGARGMFPNRAPCHAGPCEASGDLGTSSTPSRGLRREPGC